MSRAATDAVRRLRGVTWEWREDAPDAAHDQPGMGIIAQDVYAVFPELIDESLGFIRVEYDGLIPPLMTAISEIDTRLRAAERSTDMPEPEDGPIEPVRRLAPEGVETALDADAVGRVYPDLVSTDEDGERVVAYHALIGPIIEAVKELDDRLTALEENSAIEGR